MANGLKPLTTHDDSFTLRLHICPNAKVIKWHGVYQDAFKLSLQASPVDSAANKQLITILSRLFGTSKQQILLLSGEKSKQKQVKITTSGVLPEAIQLILKNEC